jgi:RNA polymerase sigma-70 factor (ECF subfamily)
VQADFKQILNEHESLLSRVASSYEANEALRQELLQEIALAVWQGLARFQGDSSVKTYILKIAHNRAITHVSTQVKRVDKHADTEHVERSHNEEANNNPEAALNTQNQVNQLLVSIRNLPINMRQVVTLSLEGLNYQEIGAVTGLTSNHVGVLLQRAKKQLTRILSE